MTTTERGPLTGQQVQTLDAYWRAANYLSVGQIYLMANPLLTEPLRQEHIKPRLLGHWGTSPGLNFIWAHLSRAITVHDAEMMIVIGPGHGGPAALANTWLEGSYSEVYPSVPQNAAGMQRLFRQFSFPGGVPSHVAPETPGSIHEGGELGYSLSHAWSWPASWVTAKPRPARWPRAGTAAGSSTRPGTAPYCPSSTSTATRSPIRRCWRASRPGNSTLSFVGTATSRCM